MCSSVDRQIWIGSIDVRREGRPNGMFFEVFYVTGGPGSSISITTRYGLDGLGIASRWGARFSAPVQAGPGAQPASCKMGTGYFSGGKDRPRRDADPSTPSSAVVMEG
jgi:hypothetical protein